MAKNENRPLPPSQLQTNEDAFAALLTIEGYTPNNPAYTLAAVTTAHTALVEKQQAAVQAQAAADAARDEASPKPGAFTTPSSLSKIRSGRNSARTQTRYRRSASNANPSTDPHNANPTQAIRRSKFIFKRET
jgi:hypothetical protein